jgi:AraC-like DNA-binding protein
MLLTNMIEGVRMYYSERKVACIDDLDRLLAERNQTNCLVEVTPVFNAPVSGETLTIGNKELKIEFSSYSNARVRGVVSDRYLSLATFLHSKPPNSIWNEKIVSGDIGWAPPNRERSAVYSERIDCMMLLLSPEQLEEQLEKQGFNISYKHFQENQILHLPEQARHLVRRSADRYNQIIRRAPQSITESDFQYIFQHLLDNFLEASLVGLEGHYQATSTSQDYTKLVQQTENFLLEFGQNLHTVGQICAHLKVSRRTLYRAFMEILELPPHVYIRNWRLARAREDLSHCRIATVTDCAFRWGFFDVGRFAGYYNGLFGELPSKTLIRYSGSQNADFSEME